MAEHGPEELRREGRLIEATTRASLMSDTKWRKLLQALDESGLEIDQCIVKFVGALNEHRTGLPRGLYLPRPWVDTFEFGPVPLRSIEWMLIPRVAEYERGDRTVPKKLVDQDVQGAAQLIAALGIYPTELSDRGLLVRGYLPLFEEGSSGGA